MSYYKIIPEKIDPVLNRLFTEYTQPNTWRHLAPFVRSLIGSCFSRAILWSLPELFEAEWSPTEAISGSVFLKKKTDLIKLT